jgi:hypothetical protein
VIALFYEPSRLRELLAFRVPIARLAAAQAVLGAGGSDTR